MSAIDPNIEQRGAVTWVRWPAYAKNAAADLDRGWINLGGSTFEITRQAFCALADALEAEGRRQARTTRQAQYWADTITEEADHAP